jgi:hypothetical protein
MSPIAQVIVISWEDTGFVVSSCSHYFCQTVFYSTYGIIAKRALFATRICTESSISPPICWLRKDGPISPTMLLAKKRRAMGSKKGILQDRFGANKIE